MSALRLFLGLVYGGELAGGNGRPRPADARRMVAETPDLASDDPLVGCAIGDAAQVARALAADPGWANQAGGPLDMPPLVAVAHSSLARLDSHRDGLIQCARLLLDAGADPNQSVARSFEGDQFRLSALYGAAGLARLPALTAMLLDAGADPNDGESLYHSLEDLASAALLLKAGARVGGSNALYRACDLDDPGAIRLLLANGGDPNEPARGPPTSRFGRPLAWAIHRRRSVAHVAALLDAGADPRATTPAGVDMVRLARDHGLGEVAAMLAEVTGAPPPTDEDLFVAACAAGDGATADAIRRRRPELPAGLPADRHGLLPDLAALGERAGVMAMVERDWPIAARGGDWDASALNHAVFRGDATLARFLLERGADWRERHGYGDDASGTLAWASLNEPVEGGDWLGCARALVDHGMPGATPDADKPGWVRVAGGLKRFSAEVTAFLVGARRTRLADGR